VLRTIEVYNRYRSPEATAELVKIGQDNFLIEFNGSFCLGCGVREYFEDFIHELENISKAFKIEMKEPEQTGSQRFKVEFIVEGNNSCIKFDIETLFHEFLHDKGISYRDYSAYNPCTRDVVRFHFQTWLFERKTKKTSL
jgi:hypothetical protein